MKPYNSIEENHVNRPCILVFGGVLVALLTGCSSGRIDLEGDATLDGVPIEMGSILLIPLDPNKGQATGGKIENGKFALIGPQAPMAGAYKVEIRAGKKSGNQVQKAMGQPGELMDEIVEGVASRFNAETILTLEVKRDAPTPKFAVSSN